jgi:PAS domain S-box-containing protein
MIRKISLHKAILLRKDRTDSQHLEISLYTLCPEIDLISTKDVRRCIKFMRNERIDALFIDSRIFDNHDRFLEELREHQINVPVIVIAENRNDSTIEHGVNEIIYDYVVRDDNFNNALSAVLEKVQRKSALSREEEDDLEEESLLFKQIYKSQKWWQNIIDAITDYLFVIDQNYKILRTNKAFANLFGKEPADIIMKPYYELFGMDQPHEWCVLPENNSQLCPRSLERSLNDMVYLISCFPIFYDDNEAVVYIMKDITENRRLKDQIYHLDKLSSLGTLTSGVAHEINNPLTGIIGYAEMLLMKDADEKTRKYLKNIYDSAIRCKRIVENMLTFSRQTPAQKSIESINDILNKTIELHEYWLKTTNIEIVKIYDEVPSISIDRQQIQQVILNLIINAEYAIEEAEKRGKLELKTEYDRSSESVSIIISDNGIGIEPDTIQKIFDPFFTTKPVNKGTGLGLSIAHGIIAEQGGNIEAESTIGKGSSFIIRIPVSRA